MLENSSFLQKKNHLGHARPNNFAFRLQDVSVRFGAIEALKNIDLSIGRGEFLFLSGTSGAGKTTLLKVLSGDQAISGGRVESCWHQQFVVTIYQELRLIETLSCLDNLRLCYDPRLYRSGREFISDLKQLTQIFHLSDRLNIKIKNTNRGLQQKIAILRALLSKPQVILADEPTSALDKDNAFQLFDLFNFYNTKRKTTIIWASHNRELIKRFNGKIIHINQGRLIHTGHTCFI